MLRALRLQALAREIELSGNAAQLWNFKSRRPWHAEPRPTLMPAICINDLREAIPRNYGTNIYFNPFCYP
jgi:hypothetical protein